MYPVTYGHTDRTYSNHKVAAELVVLLNKEDLVVNKIPREWVLLEIFNNVDNE